MSVDISSVVAALDTAYATAQEKQKAAKDRAYLDAIGADKLRKYVSVLHLARLHAVLHDNGYGGGIALLRKQLAEMGVREVQEIPDGLRAYRCRVKGCDGKLQKQEDGGYICDKCGAAHIRDKARRIVRARTPRKDAEKPATPPVQQIAKPAEKPAQQSAPELAQQSAQQSAQQRPADSASRPAQSGKSVFFPRPAQSAPKPAEKPAEQPPVRQNGMVIG